MSDQKKPKDVVLILTNPISDKDKERLRKGLVLPDEFLCVGCGEGAVRSRALKDSDLEEVFNGDLRQIKKPQTTPPETGSSVWLAFHGRYPKPEELAHQTTLQLFCSEKITGDLVNSIIKTLKKDEPFCLLVGQHTSETVLRAVILCQALNVQGRDARVLFPAEVLAKLPMVPVSTVCHSATNPGVVAGNC